MNLCLKERKKSVRATQAWVMTSVGLGLHLRLNPKLGAPKREDSATQSPHSTNWNVFIPCAHTRLTAQVRLLSSRQGKHLPPPQAHVCICKYAHTGPAYTLSSKQRWTSKLLIIENSGLYIPEKHCPKWGQVPKQPTKSTSLQCL